MPRTAVKEEQVTATDFPKPRKGRALKYEDPALMQRAIETYFREHDKWTLTGLCGHLGFSNIQNFDHYAKREGFEFVVLDARRRVVEYYEARMLTKWYWGADRMLTRLGWPCVEETKQENADKPVVLDSVEACEKAIEEAEKKKRELEEMFEQARQLESIVCNK